MSQNIQPAKKEIDISLVIHEATTKANRFITKVHMTVSDCEITDLIEIQEAALEAERALGRLRRAIMAALNEIEATQ